MSFELSIVLKTSIVLACAALICTALRRGSSAAARHTIWTTALWAVIALPAISLLFPQLNLPVLPPLQTVVIVPGPQNEQEQIFPAPVQFRESVAEAQPPAPLAPMSQPVAAEPWTWRRWLALAWGLGSLIVVMRSMAGAWEVRRLRRQSMPSPDDSRVAVEELQGVLPAGRAVEFRIGHGSIPPLTWGVFRPVILMPAAAAEWSAERRRLVLAHELAHIQRSDAWTQILAQLACSIYWFNPLIWYAAHRMRIERERACDDCVLNLGAAADDYADHLLQIARTLNSGLSFATVSMAHPSQLETRMRAILDPLTRRQTLSRLASRLVVASAAVLTTTAAVLQVTTIAPMIAPLVMPSLAPPFSVLAASPQAPIAATPAPLNGLVSLQGSVLKLGSAEPLPGTKVELIQSTGARVAAYTTMTLADGKFLFSDVQPGEYRLLASRSDGLLPAEYGQRRPDVRGLELSLRAGETMKDIQLVMAPPGAISGRVLGPDGEPVGQAQVQALRTFYRLGRRMMTIVQSVQTNDLGEYRLFWLAPGQYYITAKPVDTGARSAQMFIRPAGDGTIHDETSAPVVSHRILENGEIREEIYPPVYFPGTGDMKAATLVALRPGDNLLRLDIPLSFALPVRRIQGMVIDGSRGQPAAGATVRAIPRDAGPNIMIPNGVTDQRGLFEISSVAPGSYYLFATLASGAPGPPAGAAGRLSIDVSGEDLRNVAITVPPPVNIPGRFIVEGKGDIDLTRLRINIQRDPETFGMPNPQQLRRAGEPDPNTTQPDGSFLLAGVGAGDYRVGVTYEGIATNGTPLNLSQGTYLKSMQLGNMDVLNGGLHIDARPEGALEVVLGTTDGEIAGSVVNAKNAGIPAIAVALVPAPFLRTRIDLYRIAATNSAGRFDFKGVAPGDYSLFAWDDVESGAWLDPEFLRIFEARGTPVHITEVSREQRQLTVIEGRR